MISIRLQYILKNFSTLILVKRWLGMTLKRSISTTGLLFAAIAGIMGSGWLFGPFFAAKLAGPAAILAWILGGGLMIIVALTFAELASTFPVAGGTVRFLQLSHGPLVSYTMAWIGWLSSAAVAPIETMALLRYGSTYIPWLTHTVGATNMLSLPGIGVAALLMLVMCIINVFGVRLLSKTNNVIAVMKIIIPVFTAIVLLSTHFEPSNLFSGGFAPFGFKGILSALPMAGVIFSFMGYSPAIQLAGEAKNPQRAIPIAIIGSLIISIAVYLVLQIAFIGALAPHDFANGWDKLFFTHDAGPFVGIALSLGMVWLVDVLFIGAVLSPFGTALIYTASTARMGYAMGQNGYFPKPLMALNRHRVPARIIGLNFVIGMLLFLPFPTWQKMVGFLVTSLVFAYAVGPLALLVLRKSMPDQPRPFRLPMPRLMCLTAFYICNLIIYWTGWAIMLKMLIAIAIGYVVLAVYKRTEEGRRLNLRWDTSWWVFLYVIVIGVMSYLGSFGGGLKLIPFGWDFLAVAVYTWVIFECSQISALRKAPMIEMNGTGSRA